MFTAQATNSSRSCRSVSVLNIPRTRWRTYLSMQCLPRHAWPRTPDPQIRRRGFYADGLSFFCKPAVYRTFESQWLAVLLQTTMRHRATVEEAAQVVRQRASPRG